jgi:hypothetical protein
MIKMAEQKQGLADTIYRPRKNTQGLPSSREGWADNKRVPLKVIASIVNLPIPISQEAVRVYRLRELKSDRYALRKVLFVQIEKTEDGETFIAKVPWLDVFGLGETEEQAIDDFQLSLTEDYELMKKEEDRLSNHLQEHLGDLITILREL